MSGRAGSLGNESVTILARRVEDEGPSSRPRSNTYEKDKRKRTNPGQIVDKGRLWQFDRDEPFLYPVFQPDLDAQFSSRRTCRLDAPIERARKHQFRLGEVGYGL